jgi:hypothetical protein
VDTCIKKVICRDKPYIQQSAITPTSMNAIQMIASIFLPVVQLLSSDIDTPGPKHSVIINIFKLSEWILVLEKKEQT